METMDNFDPKICEQHLQECLKRVLCCYDEIELNTNSSQHTLSDIRNRCFIEALYQVFNLGSSEALLRAVSLSKEIRY